MIQLIMEKTVYRKCSYCFFEALSLEDLKKFVKDKRKERFYCTKNICKKCNAKRAREVKKGIEHGPYFIARCVDCQSLANSFEDMEERFIKDKTLIKKYANLCKKCQSLRNKRGRLKNIREFKEKERTKSLFENYKISDENYKKLLMFQDFRCAICKTHQSKLTKSLGVDHDHLCCPGKKSCGNCIRGLLCQKCNMAIGLFSDNKKLLNSAIIYLGG